MVERAIEADPVGAEELNIQPGQGYRGLAEWQKNFVNKQAINQHLVGELGLREEEQKTRKLDPIGQWFRDKEERRTAYNASLREKEELANTKANPESWYRKEAEDLSDNFYTIEEHRLADGKKNLGDDFLEGRTLTSRTPEFLMQEDLYGLLYSDDPGVYAKYFPGEELVPLAKGGVFNVFEYLKRKDAINAAAADAGLFGGEQFVEENRRAALDRRYDEGRGEMPEMEYKRLIAKAYIADNYWSIITSPKVLNQFSDPGVAMLWQKYAVMAAHDRKEADERGGDFSARYRIGPKMQTFKQFYGGPFLQTMRRDIRVGDDKLNAYLEDWGYTGPLRALSGGDALQQVFGVSGRNR